MIGFKVWNGTDFVSVSDNEGSVVQQGDVLIQDRLDEEFASANVGMLTAQKVFGGVNISPLKEWTLCELDVDGDVRHYYCNGCTSSIATNSDTDDNVRKIEINLIELVAVTQCISVGTLRFSNDVDGETVTTHTIADVLDRVNRQIYTFTEAHRARVGMPFAFRFDHSADWARKTAPELFFTDANLFQVLKGVGDTFAAFPKLTPDGTAGKYVLDYRFFDKVGASHPLPPVHEIEEYTTSEGSANIIDTSVENMLSVGSDGANTAVYPAYGENESDAYRAPVTEEYNTEVTNDNCFIELPRPIEKILKVDQYSETLGLGGLPGSRHYKDTTFAFLEVDDWKLLQDSNWFTSIKNSYKTNRIYYVRGDRRLYNYSAFSTSIGEDIRVTNPNPNFKSVSKTTFLRITYIPREEGRLQFSKNTTGKPITKIVNQTENVIDSSAFASSMQGLVRRLDGYRRVIYSVIERGSPVIPIGDVLDGQKVVSAEYAYTSTCVFCTYVTSKNFNRRSPFVSIPHNIRQWSIPADKVEDRRIHYAEHVDWTISEGVVTPPKGNGHVRTTAFVHDYVGDLVQYPPCLARIAWKSQAEIQADAQDQSENYALATVSSVPSGTHILYAFETDDNTSMGRRSFDKNTGGYNNYISDYQTFIKYDAKAKYISFWLGNKIPKEYNFNNDYTHLNDFTNASEGHTNASFPLSFPASTKTQFLECNDSAVQSVFDLSNENIRIDKDLRERIKMNLQLDFFGVNGILVYEKAASWSALCNAYRTTMHVFINAPSDYDESSIFAHGDEVDADVTVLADRILFEFGRVKSWTNLAIADEDGALMFATNKGGDSDKITLYGVVNEYEREKI